jgi:hypothetical protein
MENKDREIRVGENRLYLGEDNVLYVTIFGEVDEKIAIALKEADLKFKNMVEEKYDVLADLNKSGKHSSESRKIWKEMTEHDKTGKVAIFGMNPVVRVIVAFVMGVSKKKDMRFFKTREEALAWLKE